MCEEREFKPLERLKELIKNAPRLVDRRKELEVYDCDDFEKYIRKINEKLLVLSRSEAGNFVCEKPWACISIGAEPGDWPKINKVQQVDILQIAFYDTEFKREDVIYFTPIQANEILDFVDKVWDKIDLLMVHCQAGLSRSPGVAAAIARIKYGNDDFYFKNYMPNTLVYRTILNVAHERELI